MDIKQEQEYAYFQSVQEDLEKQFKAQEEKAKKEWENTPEPPKPTKEELRALRLAKLQKPTLS